VRSGTDRVNDAASTADILKCRVINKLKIVCPVRCHVTEVHEGAEEKFQAGLTRLVYVATGKHSLPNMRGIF